MTHGERLDPRICTEETGQLELIAAETFQGAVQRHRISYEYDDFGNLALQNVETMERGRVVLSQEGYFYDNLHRLIRSERSIGGVQQSPISYTYDAIGNLTSKSDYGTGYTYGDTSKRFNNAGPNQWGQSN